MSSLRILRGQRVAIITGDSLAPPALLAVDDLIAFLQRALDASPCWQRRDVALKDMDEPVCVLFGSPANNPALDRAAKAQKIALDEKALGAEGGIVQAFQAEGKTVVALAGHTQTGACHAAYSFLEQEVGVGFFLDGVQVPTLQEVDLSATNRVEKPTVPIRGLFYHSVWRHPYLNCWQLWGWEKWKFAVDWMRRKRFNLLQVFHDDGGHMWGDVIFRAFPKIPINEKTLQNFVVDPAWRTELNKKIFAYARQCGLGISYNLFFAQVPECFAPYHPDVKLRNLGMMNYDVDAKDPQCLPIIRKYWSEILNTYGMDDSHNYAICSYAHESIMPEYFKDRNEPMLMAYNIMKELDPKAKIYNETWCWKYTHDNGPQYSVQDRMSRSRWLMTNAGDYWRKFNAEMPKDLGVIEWDVVREKFPVLKDAFEYFKGRPWIQLTHTVFEGYWPPSTIRNHPAWLIDLYNEAIDHGAEGVMFFHIQAGVYDMSADLAAAIGWIHHPDLKTFYRDYARRRFGAAAADALAQSLDLFCDAVDAVNLVQTLSPVGFLGSAEDQLKKLGLEGAEKKKWLEERIGVLEEHAVLAAKATLLARSVPQEVKSDPLCGKYFWELDYVAARFEGFFGLYRAHLLAESDPARAAAEFDKALDAFFTIKKLFSGIREIRMGELRKIEPDIPFTAPYRENWESRGGYGGGRADDAHVVWERIDKFEKILRDLRPSGLK